MKLIRIEPDALDQTARRLQQVTETLTSVAGRVRTAAAITASTTGVSSCCSSVATSLHVTAGDLTSDVQELATRAAWARAADAGTGATTDPGSTTGEAAADDPRVVLLRQMIATVNQLKAAREAELAAAASGTAPAPSPFPIVDVRTLPRAAPMPIVNVDPSTMDPRPLAGSSTQLASMTGVVSGMRATRLVLDERAWLSRVMNLQSEPSGLPYPMSAAVRAHNNVLLDDMGATTV